MDLGLKDRVAIIGGSSRGIGKAIALAFAQEGASVTICARTEADLRRAELDLARVSSQQHVLAVPADLSQRGDVRRVVRDTLNRFGRIGILVTHVGYGLPGRPSELNDETIMTSLDETFMSAVRFAREVVPYMKQQHWGRIVNLLPQLTARTGGRTALSASSQLALVGYAKILANELAPFEITVNNLIAGTVRTEYLAATLEREAEAQGRAVEDLEKETLSGIPMGRLGEPEEVADMVAFLGSEKAAYLTGTSVMLDGGMFQTIS
jgi:3-oxoacyl-[acyl-carrier protein] reductase